MNRFRHLPVGQQVFLVFGTLAGLIALVGGLFFLDLRSIERASESQQAQAMKLEATNNIERNARQVQTEVLRELLGPDSGDNLRPEQSVRRIENIGAREFADYQNVIDSEPERQLYVRALQTRQAYWEQTQPLMALHLANQDAKALAMVQAAQFHAHDDFVKATKDLNEYVQTRSRNTARATSHFISAARIAGNVLVGLRILVVIGAGFAVAGFARRLRHDNEKLEIEVADRKRAEKTLRESDETFHQLADNITDAFWIRSPDMREIHYFSPAFERIWGRSVESLQANPQRWIEFTLPEDRQRVLDAFALLQGNTPGIEIEYRIVRPDGEIRWVRSRGFQVRDGNGKVIRITGIATDITDRWRAADELKESERRFSDMLRNLELVAMMLDQDKRITYCNDYLLRLTGWQREEVLGRSWFDLFVPPEITAELQHVHVGLLTDQPAASHHENEIVTKAGERRLIRWNNSVLRSASGDVIGTASIGEDITERIRLEAQLFQAQKMETVGKLAGGVAHEFNTVMTAIIGQSELLLNDLPRGSPLCSNAAEIQRAAARAAALTRQLLAYGRKQILRPEILDLNSVLAGMDTTLRHLVGPGIELQIVPKAGLKAVKADAGQIEQVILNMASNAADAMPNGGTLTLETANVVLDGEYASRVPDLKAGEYVMLAITDTGAGLTPEAKVRLFEPFFTTKGVGQGTGLGLSTCYGIIKQSGGHISVYSESTHGAVFKIYLPQVQQAAEPSLKRLDSKALPRGTETILLVEDDPTLREMGETLLKRLGYTVFAAANGIEAMGLRHRRDIGHIDLLLTDVVMPHMNGKELSERMQALDPQIRILFTSAYTEHAILHQGMLNNSQGRLEGPRTALLQKPFTPSALAQKLREMLDDSTVMTPTESKP